MKVIHQQNGGVSVARQTGIDHATGEYSIHADPDDWVELNMIEELVAKAVANNADMVICDFYRESKSDRIHVCQYPVDTVSDVVDTHVLHRRFNGGFARSEGFGGNRTDRDHYMAVRRTNLMRAIISAHFR